MKKIMLSFLQRYEDLGVLIFGLVMALVLRLLLRGYVSGDAQTGSLPWYDYIQSQGGIRALGHAFSGYPPLYLYMLTVAYYVNQVLHISHLAAIKMVSIVFDFFGAYWFGKIVQIKHPGKHIGYYAALVFLFVPTVFINGAMWGQIDGIFTSFMLAAVYYLLKHHSGRAMIAFGLALSIKFQAIFLAPVLLVLAMLGQLTWLSLLLPPAVYIISVLPAWALGRPIQELLLLYLNQVNTFPNLTLNAPSFYALIDNSVNYLFNPVGIILAIMLVLMAVMAIYKLRPRLDPDLLVGLSAACLLFVPYILPKMHERYFYPAEVFYTLLAFFRPRLSFVAVALQIAALATYNNYLFGRTFLALSTDSLVMLALVVYVLYDQARQVMASRSAPASTA